MCAAARPEGGGAAIAICTKRGSIESIVAHLSKFSIRLTLRGTMFSVAGAQLPQKPREHILESASERLFQHVMPAEWDGTRPSRDYGIDMRVEIFASMGTGATPTGLEFGVQLKATDAEDARADRVGIERPTMAYWQLLGYPVLVVRFKAGTNELFGRWAHNRPVGPDSGEPTKRAWFQFTEKDILTKEGDCWGRLAAEVDAFRQVREREIRLPLRIGLIGAKATSALEARLNAEFSRLVGPNTLVVDRAVVTPPVVVVEDRHVGVDLGGSQRRLLPRWPRR